MVGVILASADILPLRIINGLPSSAKLLLSWMMSTRSFSGVGFPTWHLYEKPKRHGKIFSKSSKAVVFFFSLISKSVCFFNLSLVSWRSSCSFSFDSLAALSSVSASSLAFFSSSFAFRSSSTSFPFFSASSLTFISVLFSTAAALDSFRSCSRVLVHSARDFCRSALALVRSAEVFASSSFVFASSSFTFVSSAWSLSALALALARSPSNSSLVLAIFCSPSATLFLSSCTVRSRTSTSSTLYDPSKS
mmetsp:Transcript_35271/g.83000  ORF Transcript_35271/g.83000 Transcript_35271/m.83000 type:complete len:249 (-) Transcript_35271:38-784(-)